MIRTRCSRPLRMLIAVFVVSLVAGCSATAERTDSENSAPRTSSTPTASSATPTVRLGEGFYDPTHPPPPEGTITPSPGSWDTTVPPRGYTAVLISYGQDSVTRALTTGVRKWAAAEGVKLSEVTVRGSTDHIDAVYAAVAKHPDVIISAGNAMIDPVAAVSPSLLKQQFLVVGGELAEPTSNVTAVDWKGATYKGEGLGLPAGFNPKSFTEERIQRAIRAGIAAVLGGVTGILVRVR